MHPSKLTADVLCSHVAPGLRTKDLVALASTDRYLRTLLFPLLFSLPGHRPTKSRAIDHSAKALDLQETPQLSSIRAIDFDQKNRWPLWGSDSLVKVTTAVIKDRVAERDMKHFAPFARRLKNLTTTTLVVPSGFLESIETLRFLPLSAPPCLSSMLGINSPLKSLAFLNITPTDPYGQEKMIMDPAYVLNVQQLLTQLGDPAVLPALRKITLSLPRTKVPSPRAALLQRIWKAANDHRKRGGAGWRLEAAPGRYPYTRESVWGCWCGPAIHMTADEVSQFATWWAINVGVRDRRFQANKALSNWVEGHLHIDATKCYGRFCEGVDAWGVEVRMGYPGFHKGVKCLTVWPGHGESDLIAQFPVVAMLRLIGVEKLSPKNQGVRSVIKCTPLWGSLTSLIVHAGLLARQNARGRCNWNLHASEYTFAELADCLSLRDISILKYNACDKCRPLSGCSFESALNRWLPATTRRVRVQGYYCYDGGLTESGEDEANKMIKSGIVTTINEWRKEIEIDLCILTVGKRRRNFI